MEWAAYDVAEGGSARDRDMGRRSGKVTDVGGFFPNASCAKVLALRSIYVFSLENRFYTTQVRDLIIRPPNRLLIIAAEDKISLDYQHGFPIILINVSIFTSYKAAFN